MNEQDIIEGTWYLHRHSIVRQLPVLLKDITKLCVEKKKGEYIAKVKVSVMEDPETAQKFKAPVRFEQSTQSWHGEYDHLDLRFAVVEHDGIKIMIGHISDRSVRIKRDVFVGLDRRREGDAQPKGKLTFKQAYSIPLDRLAHTNDEDLTLNPGDKYICFQGKKFELNPSEQHPKGGWLYEGNCKKDSILLWLLPTQEGATKHWILAGLMHVEKKIKGQTEGLIPIVTLPGSPICTQAIVALTPT